MSEWNDFALNSDSKTQELESIAVDRINEFPQEIVLARLRSFAFFKALNSLEMKSWLVQETLLQEKIISDKDENLKNLSLQSISRPESNVVKLEKHWHGHLMGLPEGERSNFRWHARFDDKQCDL